jgi:hypothetical protein
MGIFGHRTVAAAVQRRMRKTACLVMWEGAGRNRQRATDCFAGGSQPATNKANKIIAGKMGCYAPTCPSVNYGC